MRHCERSEAIQEVIERPPPDCFAALATTAGSLFQSYQLTNMSVVTSF